MGKIHRENADLTGGTQVHVSVTRYTYHRPRHKKILDGYDYFNTYVVIVSLRATTHFGPLDVRRHVMTLEASRVLIRIYHNHNNTTLLSTLSVLYLRKSYEQLFSRIK